MLIVQTFASILGGLPVVRGQIPWPFHLEKEEYCRNKWRPGFWIHKQTFPKEGTLWIWVHFLVGAWLTVFLVSVFCIFLRICLEQQLFHSFNSSVMQDTSHLTLKFISYLLSRNSGKDYSSFPDWVLFDIAQVISWVNKLLAYQTT